MTWKASKEDSGPLARNGSFKATISQIVAFAIAIASATWYLSQRMSAIEQRLVAIEVTLKDKGVMLP